MSDETREPAPEPEAAAPLSWGDEHFPWDLSELDLPGFDHAANPHQD